MGIQCKFHKYLKHGFLQICIYAPHSARGNPGINSSTRYHFPLEFYACNHISVASLQRKTQRNYLVFNDKHSARARSVETIMQVFACSVTFDVFCLSNVFGLIGDTLRDRLHCFLSGSFHPFAKSTCSTSDSQAGSVFTSSKLLEGPPFITALPVLADA